jgi:hypothetical protein
MLTGVRYFHLFDLYCCCFFSLVLSRHFSHLYLLHTLVLFQNTVDPPVRGFAHCSFAYLRKNYCGNPRASRRMVPVIRGRTCLGVRFGTREAASCLSHTVDTCFRYCAARNVLQLYFLQFLELIVILVCKYVWKVWCAWCCSRTLL